VLLVAFAALTVMSPFTLELATDLCAVNHNGVYNRFGAAFLVVTFAAASRPRGARASSTPRSTPGFSAPCSS
jgi:hypothetical protein